MTQYGHELLEKVLVNSREAHLAILTWASRPMLGPYSWQECDFCILERRRLTTIGGVYTEAEDVVGGASLALLKAIRRQHGNSRWCNKAWLKTLYNVSCRQDGN